LIFHCALYPDKNRGKAGGFFNNIFKPFGDPFYKKATRQRTGDYNKGVNNWSQHYCILSFAGMTGKGTRDIMPEMKPAASVYDVSPVYAFYKTFTVPSMRSVTLLCVARILYNFFLRQYIAAWLPGRVPVSRVDHPLDKKIPFVPSWVTIYLDFIFFWIRMISFLLRSFGRRAYGPVKEFIESMGRLYVFAAEIYGKNFSTTDRPFYIARPRFFLIHLLDPHLMCVPSLHVMVVMWTYARFAAILRSMGEAEHYAAHIEEMKQGALAITRAILFVKQHSVNCIPAAFYIITCFSPELFTQEEVEDFANRLFPAGKNSGPGHPARTKTRHSCQRHLCRVHPDSAPATEIPAAAAGEITAHIIDLYRRFLSEGKTAKNREEPLLRFLGQFPKK